MRFRRWPVLGSYCHSHSEREQDLDYVLIFNAISLFYLEIIDVSQIRLVVRNLGQSNAFLKIGF